MYSDFKKIQHDNKTSHELSRYLIKIKTHKRQEILNCE